MPARRRQMLHAARRRRRASAVLGAVIGMLGATLVVAGFTAAAMLRATLPPDTITLAIPALRAPVSIALDAQGVPRIAAASEHDAAIALGVLHARDRLFQMELMRRGAAGRLAEILGPPALRSDRFVRTLGLAARARADLAALAPETRALLEAYAAGVNAWIAAKGRAAAPEFLVLGAPEPWAPEHSLAWAKIMGLWLSGDWRMELARERLATAGLPEPRIAELWPVDDSDGRPDRIPPPPRGALLDGAHLDRLASALPRFPEDPGSLPASASNAWALAGTRAEGGAPLLASDPHLGFQAPSTWYLARIDLPGGHMRAGATSPGVPLVVIGRNERIAWGFTTTHADTQDLYVERLVGADAYATPDGPRPFVVRDEVIHVRGRAAPEVIRVRETRHGPVLSDLDEVARASPGTVVAVAMANLAPGDSAAEGLLALNRATDLAGIRAAAALITSPAQNLMVADAAGRIGLFLTGRIPARRAGDGSRPARGWDGSQDWIGFIPFDALPHVEDPESGAVANANNRVAPRGDERLARDWPGDWRFRRIGALLAATPRHDAHGLAAMQMDVVSVLASDLLAPGGVLRRAPRPGGAAGVALDLLLAWDGTVATERPEPLILAAWRDAMIEAAMTEAGVPPAARPYPTPQFLAFLMHPDGRGAWWCGGDCPAMAARAMQAAVAGLVPRFGPDPRRWRWGAVHVARFEHPVLRFLPGLDRLTRLEAVTAGDGETIGRGAYRGTGADRFAHVHGAELRFVADLGDAEGAFAVIATGQSGNPLSPHWGDLLERWREGRMLRLGPGMADRPAAVLRLHP